MRDMDLKLSDRMNALEWVSRNAMYLTPNAISDCINTFKLQYSNSNQSLTNAFIFSNHTSDIILSIYEKLEKLVALQKSEENEKKILDQLSILEPALINDMNLEIALSKNIHAVFIKLIDTKSLANENNARHLPSLKYLMR
jgi:hypothetical protein